MLRGHATVAAIGGLALIVVGLFGGSWLSKSTAQASATVGLRGVKMCMLSSMCVEMPYSKLEELGARAPVSGLTKIGKFLRWARITFYGGFVAVLALGFLIFGRYAQRDTSLLYLGLAVPILLGVIAAYTLSIFPQGKELSLGWSCYLFYGGLCALIYVHVDVWLAVRNETQRSEAADVGRHQPISAAVTNGRKPQAPISTKPRSPQTVQPALALEDSTVAQRVPMRPSPMLDLPDDPWGAAPAPAGPGPTTAASRVAPQPKGPPPGKVALNVTMTPKHLVLHAGSHLELPISWSRFTHLVVRQFGGDTSGGVLFMDLICGEGAGQRPVVRVTRATTLRWSEKLTPWKTVTSEPFRNIGLLAHKINSKLSFDKASFAFVQHEFPARILSVEEFSEYDGQLAPATESYSPDQRG